MENEIAEKESALQEMIEAVEYESEDEDEEITSKLIKDYLTEQIKTMEQMEDAEKEIAALKESLMRSRNKRKQSKKQRTV